MDIEFLKSQLEDVRQQMRGKNRNNPVEAAEYVELKKDEDALIEMITAAQKDQAVEKKDAEIQELVLGHNFNQIFGDPEANKLVHGVMMELVGKYEGTIAGLYSEIEQKDQSYIAVTEELSNKSADLDKLQADFVEVSAKAEELAGAEDRVNGLKKIIEEKDKEIAELKARVEEEQKDARFYRNESARYELESRRLRTENEELKRTNTLSRDTNTNEVAQRIMERTNQKRKLANVRTNSDGSITGTDAEGREVTVPWFAKNSVEAVDTFPEATETNVEESAASNTALVEPIEAPTFQKPEDDTSGVPDVHASTAQGDSGDKREDDAPVSAEQVSRQEFEAIVKRVERIEKYANITEGAA